MRIARPTFAPIFFEAVLTLNRSRNQTIVASLAHVVSVLNTAGIEPVLLKGAAHLANGLYPDFVGGPHRRRPRSPGSGRKRAGCVEIAPRRRLRRRRADAAGFAPHAPSAAALRSRHRRGRGTAHRGSPAPRRGIRPGSLVPGGGTGDAFRGVSARIPDATRGVAHAIVHDQLQDGGYRHRDGAASDRSSIWP